MLRCFYAIISFSGQRLIAFFEFFLRKYTTHSEKIPAWSFNLATYTDLIRGEFQNIYNETLREFRKISPEQGRITAGNSWKVFIMKAYGRNLVFNRLLCPITAGICDKVPEITTLLFSVLEPNTHLLPHRGLYAGVIRCHIPLIVPQGDCGLRVGDKYFEWRMGEPIIFDDTIDHEAWNRTNERRVVLFIDFLRPLPLLLAIPNRLLIWLIGYSPFIGRMLRASL
jgi:aspartyl/asparaginyl beta-hydroxylase (cupin superfamily)